MVIAPIHSLDLRYIRRMRPRDYFPGTAFYFRRGSHALAAALDGVARERKRNRATRRVLFPDYFCREPLEDLSKRRFDISFYRVRENLEPDWQHVVQLAQNGPAPDAFVLVHYFGFSNAIVEARTHCASLGVPLIEDCAHVMHPFSGVGTIGAAAVFSPWKFFPLPDLGLLLVREQSSLHIDAIAPSRQVRHWVQWFTERQAHLVLRKLHVNWYRSEREHRVVRVPVDAAPNHYSQRAFLWLLGQAERIAHRRQQNYRSLEEWFAHHHPGALLFTRAPPSVIPYVFPCRTEQSAAAVGRRLRQHGIPAFPWPSLPDGVRGDESQHATANWLADHILLLPVHQNVSATQIAYMQQQLTLLW